MAALHHHDAVGHGHRLGLVVGDVDRGDLELLVQRLDLGAHLYAQLGIEIAERFVEQEDLRIAHDGPAHGDALPLATGQFARPAVEIGFKRQNLGRPPHLPVDLFGRDAAQLERESHILRDGHMRIERVGLEHHGDVAILGRQIIDHAAVDPELAIGDGFKARHHAEQGRLAAARGADQHDEFAIGDFDIDTVDNRHIAIGFVDAFQRDRSHD
jgi:hypothetical protein